MAGRARESSDYGPTTATIGPRHTICPGAASIAVNVAGQAPSTGMTLGGRHTRRPLLSIEITLPLGQALTSGGCGWQGVAPHGPLLGGAGGGIGGVLVGGGVLGVAGGSLGVGVVGVGVTGGAGVRLIGAAGAFVPTTG